MDLRAPLPPEHCIVSSNDDDNASSTLVFIEQSMKYLLCRMYLASQMMELGSESRFTSIILFRRYSRHFERVIKKNYCQQTLQQKQNQKGRKPVHEHDNILPSPQELKQIKCHLGRIAAACLFLGCKAEEEPRRIRDVINLSSLLDFEDLGGESPNMSMKVDINCKANESNSPKLSLGHSQRTPASSSSTVALDAVEIRESKYPPLLDEKYWSDKEQMVSTEQQLLRMLQFDTLVCHPYRCVLIVMDTLDFGRGSKFQDQAHCLLSPRVSEALIFKAWTILNEISIDIDLGTTILQYNIVTLACAVISVAADANRSSSSSGNGRTLPVEWWRALDVPTNDLISAADCIRNLLHERGTTNLQR